MDSSTSGKRLFVTVGSTKFDALVDSMLSDSMRDTLRAAGFTHLVVQLGNSNVPPKWTPMAEGLYRVYGNVQVDWWRFKPDLADEINAADLIVSHAGSGTILDVLRRSKKLIVVPNDTLLDNHQNELAKALQQGGHLLAATITSLPAVIEASGKTELRPFPQSEGDKFRRLVDQEMGFS